MDLQPRLGFAERQERQFFPDVVDENKNLKGEYKKYQLGRIVTLASQFHGFNTQYPGVSNVHLRRAISFAIDRRKIVKYILKNQAAGPGENGLVPPSMPGFPFEQVHGFVFNPDSARAEFDIAKKELTVSYTHLTLPTKRIV